MNPDLMLLLFASFALFLVMFTGRRRVLDRWEAIVMLIVYLAYMVFIIVRD
jgi:cation:H+ antiporter